MTVKRSLSLFFFLLICFRLFAQGEIDDQLKIFYDSERTLAIKLKTNGWEFDYRYSERKTGFSKRPYQISFSHIKHPKEYKNSTLGIKYVYGKLYSFFTLNANIGFQKELFSKFDKNSVEIRSIFLLGPTLGIKKPSYYKTAPSGSNTDEEEIVRFSKAKNHSIQSNASFFYGITETEFIPGINSYYSCEFEFSSSKKYIRAIEIGTAVKIFPVKINILDSATNTFIFPNIFIGFRFGQIVGI